MIYHKVTFFFHLIVKDSHHKEILENSDCLMVFILSHGESDNKVMAKDGPYDIYELIEKFIPNNLGILHGKPKLFFIQACRGCNYDNGQIIIPNGVNPDDSKTELGSYIHPKFADVLISFSTYYGLNSCYISFNFFDKFFRFYLQGTTHLVMKRVHGLFKIYVMF